MIRIPWTGPVVNFVVAARGHVNSRGHLSCEITSLPFFRAIVGDVHYSPRQFFNLPFALNHSVPSKCQLLGSERLKALGWTRSPPESRSVRHIVCKLHAPPECFPVLLLSAHCRPKTLIFFLFWRREKFRLVVIQKKRYKTRARFNNELLYTP